MPRIDDYKTAIALAVEELQKINPKRLANSIRCQYFLEGGAGGAGGREGLLVPYFGQSRRVSWPEINVTPGDGAGQIPLTEQILILHYLIRARGEALSGRNIDFRQVPEGGFYWAAFVSRAQKPLLASFGQDLEFYLQVAVLAGGEPQQVWGTPRPASWPFPWCP